MIPGLCRCRSGRLIRSSFRCGSEAESADRPKAGSFTGNPPRLCRPAGPASGRSRRTAGRLAAQRVIPHQIRVRADRVSARIRPGVRGIGHLVVAQVDAHVVGVARGAEEPQIPGLGDEVLCILASWLSELPAPNRSELSARMKTTNGIDRPSLSPTSRMKKEARIPPPPVEPLSTRLSCALSKPAWPVPRAANRRTARR